MRLAHSDPFALGRRYRAPVDIAMCPDCIDELFDSNARRYRYPFTHCAQCGPRASILYDQPFERENTSFNAFTPCKLCQSDFGDPTHRHYLDPTVSCPACGPRHLAYLGNGNPLDEEPLELAAKALRDGAVLALKGYGSFQLAVDATNARAVEELRARWELPAKPLPVLVPNLETAHALGVLTPENEALLAGPERAVVVVPRRSEGIEALGLSKAIAPRTGDIGLALPHCPCQYLLFWAPGKSPGNDLPRFDALVLCAATLLNQPSIHENEDALVKLGHVADLFLVHDRGIAQPYDDPVFLGTQLGPVPLRLSRSTTPRVFELSENFLGAPPILAVGSDSRCAPAIFSDGEIHLSAHIGNLIAEESADALVHSVTEMCHVLRVFPEFVSHGLSSDNLGTHIAQGLGIPTLAIQHHHAHAVSCLVEHGLEEEALALVLDCADWGTDETLWGGELLRVSHTEFKRLRHFEEITLPGGKEAIKEPWRSAASWLWQAFPAGDAPELSWHTRLKKGALNAMEHMRERGINTPRVSSCGHLLQAACSLLDRTDRLTYECEALHVLESLATRTPEPWRPPRPDSAAAAGNGSIPMSDLIRSLVFEHADGDDSPSIARRFYEGLTARLAAAVIDAATRQRLDRVILTGACFEGRLLLETLCAQLSEAGLEPLIHRRVPPNDGGLAVGQAAIAAARALANPEPVSSPLEPLWEENS